MMSLLYPHRIGLRRRLHRLDPTRRSSRMTFPATLLAGKTLARNQTGGHFATQAYRIEAEPVSDGRAYWRLPQTSSVYPNAPENVRIDVEARRTWYPTKTPGMGSHAAQTKHRRLHIPGHHAGTRVQIAKVTAGGWKRVGEGRPRVAENASLRAECTGGEGQVCPPLVLRER